MLQLDVGAHPGMDAALEMLYLVGVQLCRVQGARCDEVIGLEGRAFGSLGRVPGEIVQQGKNAAAELRDAGEGVHFAADVEGEDVLPRIQLDVLRAKTPLRCLLRHGFLRVFILNGHGGNADGFHLALRQLAIEFPDALLGGASYWELADQEISVLLEGKRKGVGHACEFETSLMMHLRPELVRTQEIRDDELKPVPEALRHVYIPLDMKRQTSQGGTGQPTLATAEKGKALLEVVVGKGVETIKAMRTTKLA